MRTSETSARTLPTASNPKAIATIARSVRVGSKKGMTIYRNPTPTSDAALNPIAEDTVRLLVGVVRRSHHRPHRGMREAKAISFPLEHRKTVRVHIAQHRQMRCARLEILADGKHVDPVRAHVAQHGENFV